MSDTKAVTKKRPPAEASILPAPSVMREMLLTDAGFGHPEQVALLRKVIEGAEHDLEAEKVTPILWQGELKGEHRQADYSARAKAREQIIDLLGVKAKDVPAAQPTKTDTGVKPAPWMIQVNVGSKAQGPTVEASVLPTSTAQEEAVEVMPTLPSTSGVESTDESASVEVTDGYKDDSHSLS